MVIILAVAVLCSIALAAEKETGLVLHYTFDKGADSILQDESGRGNNGEILGGAKRVTGKFGSALGFNGCTVYPAAVDRRRPVRTPSTILQSVAYHFDSSAPMRSGLHSWMKW